MWYLWSENIKKRACRYLLQRYLGNFLEEKLTLDQLSVDLYNGTGTVSDVSLDCDVLNELGDAQNWPLEIVDGHVKEIMVSVPWSTLLSDDSVVKISGLTLTVQPKVRAEPVSSMLESMWSSMSSSMQLAAECLKEDVGPQDSQPVEGIEMFAHAIDSILSRVKVKFENTILRIEHVPKNGDRGIALEVHIKNIDYFDEAGSEPTPGETDPDKPKTYIVAAYTNKKIKFDGVTLYTDEFPSRMRTMARSLIMEKSVSSQADKAESQETPDVNFQSTISDVFYETRSVISTIETETFKEANPDEDQIKSRPESRESTPEKVNHPDPILFAKLIGEQELALKLKHNSEVEGPKVEVNMSFGSLIVFITPRQLHTLIELADALNQPDLEDRTNIPLRPSGTAQCKPMKPADFQLIEAQLLDMFEKHKAKFAGSKSGWSGPGYDEEDENEIFYPMTSQGPMAESFSSSVSSMSASMTSSATLPTGAPRIKRNKKGPHIEGDPTAEVSHISLKIESVACVLLHKDILVPTLLGSDVISPSTAIKLQEVASTFFASLELFTIVDDFTAANEILDRTTLKSHLRLLTSEISVDGSERVTAVGSQMLCEASIKDVLVRECLYYSNEEGDDMVQGYNLIKFLNKDNEDSSSRSSQQGASEPHANIRITFRQTSRYARGEQRLVNPSTDIVIKCTPFYVDVELTIIERMWSTFFGGSNTGTTTPAPTGSSQNQTSVTLQCPDLHAVLRFPIADLRQGVNREFRSVRPDYLLFKFQNATITSQQTPSSRPQPTTVTVRATILDLYYYENDIFPATHIARTTIDDNVCEGNILSGHVTSAAIPTISITFKPKIPAKGPFDGFNDEPSNFEPANSNPMTTSFYLMNNLTSKHPSPFSGKKMVHQSFTKHEDEEKAQEEEMIVPGNEDEMAEFTSNSIDLSAIHLDFILPILSLQLESKQLYEIIYNRINSDLLLWEPQPAEQYDINPLQYPDLTPGFGAFKTAGHDSDTESTSSEEETNLYYSTYDNKLRKGIGHSRPHEETETHNFCLTLKVGKGVLTMYTPVRDSNKRVVPGQMGELVLDAYNLSMCQVSGLNGKPKTAQLCLRADRTTLYHDSMITIPSEKPPLRQYGTMLPSHLKSTIYPSGRGVIIKDKLLKKDMFTMALKVAPDAESSNVKSIVIALGIEQATLRYRGDKGISWLTQLMDIIDVIDYPVPGYTPSTVMSELHVHVVDCAVDYRPLYLPFRTVLTLGNFSVTSNLIAATNTSCLRFIAQECTLFLMHILGTKPNAAVPLDDDKLPDIVKDYVCVVDLGVFELSLRMADKNNCPPNQPHVDLSASNNMVTLHTCWDSASALFRLLTYASMDGDSTPPIDRSSRHTSICSDQPLEQLVGLDDRPVEEIRELSPSEIQQVNDLMAEAMKESPNTTLEEEDLQNSMEEKNKTTEVFYFPDESNMKRRPTAGPSEEEPLVVAYDDLPPKFFNDSEKPFNIHVAKELGDPTSTPKRTPRRSKRRSTKSSSDGGNTDDEFCFVDSQSVHADEEMDDPGVKNIRPPTPPPPQPDEHYTKPKFRTDVLDAPKNYPQPMLRYKLLEMSITWNLYGGNDFRTADQPLPKKKVTIDDPRSQGSPTTSRRSQEFEPYESGRAATAAYRSSGVRWAAGSDRVRAARPATHRDLRERGGLHRDHNIKVKICLNKVKFVYDIYPSRGIYASRQTLAITKIEILDQLVCSDINKLLSQYRHKDEPERKHAHMFYIKCVHRRPDPELSAQECCVVVSVLPLWFNLDQDTLNFLAAFVNKLGSDEYQDEDSKSVGGLSTDSSGSRQTTPTHRPPVMTLGRDLRDPPPTPSYSGDTDSLHEPIFRNDEPLMEKYEAERLVSENLIQLEEDFNKLGVQEKPQAKTSAGTEHFDDSPIYFRRFVFKCDVPIRLDYVGKRVDLSAGPIAGLLMGLAQLNCSELLLKKLEFKLGLLGIEKLIQYATTEWMNDIKRHQLPGLIGGIGPMHSVLQFVAGMKDLVWLPYEQWRRDGRVAHGLRRGAASFTAHTALAALDITTRLLKLIQATAETAFDLLTPGPTLQLQEAYARRERRRRRRHDPARHPADIREGVASAYQTVREGFEDTAATMAAAARWSNGVGVLRHLPGAAVAPLALAAAGVADVLGGVRASLAPDHSRHHADKWRAHPPDNPHDCID
ncbi:autophagy-related protein 2 homolog A isoform X1 [Spodoptera litura]|uniref:Autophagy-related protein 2 n=1 Tax=Spodoptera litura TaxID=69820 RepID=A0A9J7IKH0_SPOLT|nr:autophagy-related protein 2 homolog A isoform X1 [Spodoptera litura]